MGEAILKASNWHAATIVSAVFFCAFSAVHLIDDFLSDVPSEFNLSVPSTLFLTFAYMLSIVGLLAAASHRSSTGYLGLGIAGILILLAQLLKSVPEMLMPGPWHLGTASEIAAIGLGLFGAVTAICSFKTWRLAKSRFSKGT
jgi:hypothetical protein